MSNHKYTPTTRTIRLAYVDSISRNNPDEYGDDRIQEISEEFDRWLVQVEAAAEQRGAERALRELAKDAALVPAAPDKAAKFYRDRADRIADRLEGKQ